MSRCTSLVIGAACDVGLAVCRALAARGDALVVATHRQALALDEATLGTPVTRLQADVTDAGSLAALFEQAAAHAPRHLVYVAGHHRLKPLSLRDDGDLARHWAVNGQGAVDAARLFALQRGLPRPPEGAPRSITLVASIAHRQGAAGLVAYGATKAAMVAAAPGVAVGAAMLALNKGMKAKAQAAHVPVTINDLEKDGGGK